ncbi:MAG: hypothetical protein HUJ86_01830 [Synergistes sp.]|nr:hypothetical protein [Synergistes sp.]
MNIGLPGDLLRFATYAAAPFYGASNLWGRLGAFIFFLAFVLSTPDFKDFDRAMSEVHLALASSIPSAVIAAIFFRFDLGTFLGLQGYALFASGFLFFWINVTAVRFILIPAARTLSARPAASVPFLWLILSLCGAALIAVNVNL